MKTNLAVFFGCSSVEHEISIISAIQAIGNMNEEKYNIIPVYVTKKGEMYTGDCLKKIETFKNSLANIPTVSEKVCFLKCGDQVFMHFINQKVFAKKKDCLIDVAFPIVHGTNCEDGSLAGYFEILGLPYVGCDVLSSAVGMDKVLFKNILHDRGIPTLTCIDFSSREWISAKNSIIEKIELTYGYPVIIKPCNLGSSVGISKAKNIDELKTAIDLACSFSDRVLVEKAVSNLREINCSVLGDRSECSASKLEEPVMKDEILSYDDKYKANPSKNGSEGMASTSRKLPADLPVEKSQEIQEIAVETFKAIGASGVVRIDFLLDHDNDDAVYVNEINTIPGSLSFYLWEASGLKYTELLDKMIDLAFKRQRNRQNLMFTIDTNILNESSFGAKGSKGKI